MIEVVPLHWGVRDDALLRLAQSRLCRVLRSQAAGRFPHYARSEVRGAMVASAPSDDSTGDGQRGGLSVGAA